MDVIDLLITIVVVTILVTIILAVVTYVAYKLRLAREPSALERAADGLRYFVRHTPPAASGEGVQTTTTRSPVTERHAPEA
jgi:Tfp pilus assembly protein PilE